MYPLYGYIVHTRINNVKFECVCVCVCVCACVRALERIEVVLVQIQKHQIMLFN